MSSSALRRRAGRAFLVACGLAFAPLAAAQDVVAVPGTTAALVPPPGFVASSQFAGFVRPDTQASILVVELPAEAMAEIAPAFASVAAANAAFLSQGIVIASAAEVHGQEGTRYVLGGTQASGGETFRKWILLAGGARTVMVTINLPLNDADIDDAAVAELASSLTLSAPPSLAEQVAQLPFTIEETDDFPIRFVLGGTTVGLSPLAQGEPAPDGRPLVIVTSQSGSFGGDLAALSERQLRGTRGYANVEITTSEATRFAGTEGWRLVGRSEGEAGEGMAQVMQLLAVRSEGYLRLVATTPEAQWDAYLPRMETIAASVGWK